MTGLGRGLHAPHATRSSDSARGLCRKLAQSPYERGDEAGPEIVGCLDRRDRNGVPAYGHACARPGRWRWCRTSWPQISDRLAEVLRDDLIVAEFPQGFCDRPAETNPSPSEEVSHWSAGGKCRRGSGSVFVGAVFCSIPVSAM